MNYSKFLDEKEKGQYRVIEQIEYFEGENCVDELLKHLIELDDKYFESCELSPIKSADEMVFLIKLKIVHL